MPFYDYYCEQNQKTVEVYHSINVKVKTWGELCKRVGIEPGSTDEKAPVIRLISDVNPQIFRLKGLDKDAPSGKLEL